MYVCEGFFFIHENPGKTKNTEQRRIAIQKREEKKEECPALCLHNASRRMRLPVPTHLRDE